MESPGFRAHNLSPVLCLTELAGDISSHFQKGTSLVKSKTLIHQEGSGRGWGGRVEGTLWPLWQVRAVCRLPGLLAILR